MTVKLFARQRLASMYLTNPSGEKELVVTVWGSENTEVDRALSFFLFHCDTH